MLLATLGSSTAAVASGSRSVSWWFECGNNASIDAANVAALAKLKPSAVTRVMPDFDFVKGDKEGPVPASGYGIMYGDISVWWDWEVAVHAWLDPMKKALPHTKILPWALDTTNATMMHDKVYPNASRFIAEAVAIAAHYNFDGWHIDYEDEHPSDTYPHRNKDLQSFLKEFSDVLHSKGKELVIDVASWSGLLSNFSSIAASGVDQLQDYACGHMTPTFLFWQVQTT